MRHSYKTAFVVLIILLSFLVLLDTSCDCQNQDTTQTQTPTDIGGKSFIWKVSSDTTSVYLLGSVHVARPDIYPLDSTIEDAFNSADYLVVEVNTNNISISYASQLLLEYGTYSNSHGFKESVSEDLYNKLDERFWDYGINLILFDDYKPFVLYNMLSQYILDSFGYKAEYGIDFYFLDKAEKSNMVILELETAELQMDLLSSVPDETIIKMMQYDIDNPGTEAYLQELFDVWVDGDVVGMETVAFGALDDEPELAPYYEILYDQRNFNMAKKIEEFLSDDETYFIVVGAAHLVGDNGLINLLVNKGYDVEQLDNSG
jgi:uncharacterized protein YbaP (TraB family)